MKLVFNRSHPQRRNKYCVGDVIRLTDYSKTIGDKEVYKIIGWNYCTWDCYQPPCPRGNNVMVLVPVKPNTYSIDTDKKQWGFDGSHCFCIGNRKCFWTVIRRENANSIQHWKQEVV